MKRWLIVLLLINVLLFINEGKAQTGNRPLYKIYEFGAWFDPGNSCEIELRKKYGFRTTGAGCIATKRLLKHNDKVERKLKERNGKNWRVNYSADLENCKEK